VEQLIETGRGGQVGSKLKKGLQRRRRGEVVVLFGGKGSGKSTFIKRLLYHKQPPWLQRHAIIAIIDLLEVPEDQTIIHNHIWNTLIGRLDVDQLLDSDRSTIIRELFWDRFAVAKKQELFGLSGSSESYNLKLNDMISEWKRDYSYCARRLTDYWSASGRGIIVVVDNTDQFSSTMQDFCFTSAQEISNVLRCVTVISMREERYHNSKVHGLLDAFQNAGFHISSPKPANVFKKRLQYTSGLLQNPFQRKSLVGDISETVIRDSCVYLGILLKEFSSDKSPLNNFLTACALGDIRLSLDLFRSFISSGYTNVEEMVANGSWNVQIHQVIKPVMIPTRYFYDEKLSDIPNIYQIRDNRNGSHFTALRILRKLAKSTESAAPSYVSAPQLLGFFADTFNMVDDCVKNMDLLLKHGFIASNSGMDEYSSDVD
jgi:GTPase SAR1 family protein